MPAALIALIVFLTAASVSAVGVGPVLTFARRFGLYDVVDFRRVHDNPVPRIGGLAIYFGFLVAIGISFVLSVDRFAEEIERIVLLVIGGTIVVGTMFFDDVIGIRPWPKLAIQTGVSLLVILPRLHDTQSGIIIEQFNVPFAGTVQLSLWLAIGFTLFWIVGMMNVLNWSDGLDGLAGSIALIAATVLFLHTYFWPRGNPQFTISLLAIALVGAIAGFMPYNWHPARIIMGDSGAMFLGFCLAVISIIGGAKIATALLALGVPIIDTAWVIFNRLMNRKSPMEPDRIHLHHRLLDVGWSQPQIVAGFVSLAAGFGMIGLFLPNRELKLIALGVLGLIFLGIVTVVIRRGQNSPEVRERIHVTAGASRMEDRQNS